MARTMLALLTLLDFPSIINCDDSEENLLVSLELFEAQLSSTLLCGGSGSRLQPEPPQVQAKRSWVTRGTMGEESRSSLRSVLFGE